MYYSFCNNNAPFVFLTTNKQGANANSLLRGKS